MGVSVGNGVRGGITLQAKSQMALDINMTGYFIVNGFFPVFSLFCVGREGTDRSQ